MKFKTLLLVCLATYTTVYGQPTKIYLSPKAAGAANQSTFIDSIKFHPLETTKRNSISNYSYAYVAGDYYFVNNYMEKNVLVYTKEGKFVKEIDYKKLGTSPNYDKNKQQLIFLSINKNYTLTEKDNIQIRTDFDNPRNKKYYKKYVIDLNDTTYSIKKVPVTSFDILHAYNLKDDLYCTYEISVNKNYKDSLDYEVKIYKDTRFVKGYFPYNKRSEPRYLYARGVTAFTQETNQPDVFFITRPYTDTIYTLSNGVVTPAYQLILPMENSVPKSFFDTPFKNATDRENFERNNGWLLRQIYSFTENSRYMMFAVGFFSNYG